MILEGSRWVPSDSVERPDARDPGNDQKGCLRDSLFIRTLKLHSGGDFDQMVKDPRLTSKVFP